MSEREKSQLLGCRTQWGVESKGEQCVLGANPEFHSAPFRFELSFRYPRKISRKLAM